MKLIHYILFLPLAFIFGYYIKKKSNDLFPNQKQDKLRNIAYYFIVLLIFIISIITLSYFAVYFFYVALFYAIFDCLFFLIKYLEVNKAKKYLLKLYQRGITVYIIAAILTGYGMYVAHNPTIHKYEFDLKKSITETKILMLSDLHLGTGSTEYTVNQIVDEINNQKPDLFVLVGDIFDEGTTDELKEYAYQNFGAVKTKYGTYIVEGNHDYINKEMRSLWDQHHVKVLQDKVKLINNEFYLVGRKDYSRKQRKSLTELLTDINKNLPIIVLDHQPVDSIKAAKLGVDLQLSGHTHNGQLFPGSLFVKHGLIKIKDYHLAISNGYGTWGIPIRTSGRGELLIVTLK